jgi:hypothetical protein
MSTDAIEALSFFFGTAAALWAGAYAWSQWLKHRYDDERLRELPPSIAPQRVANLETAVEALAIELERIGEAQRYTLKLLEERLPQSLGSGRSPSAEGGRVVTPH